MDSMVRSLMPAAALTATLAVAACGCSPPPHTDTASAAYKTDLVACDAAATDAVAKRNAKRGYTWAASPVTRWSQIGDATGVCRADTGWRAGA
jgi:hypothetical protein